VTKSLLPKAIPPIVAESMKALSAFINSVLNCRISELSALIVLIVALSAVTCDKVICVVARLPIVAESIVTAPACIVL